MAGRPHVLVLTWHFPLWSERFVLDHVEGLLAHDWDVSVCCASLDRTALAEHAALVGRLRTLVEVDAVVRPSPWRRAASLLAEGEARAVRSPTARHAALLAGPLRRVLRQVQPDLVHAHYGPNAAAAALAVGVGGPPVVADLHGFDLTDRPLAEGWGPSRRLLGGVHVVVHSAYAAGQVRGGTGVEASVVRLGTPPCFRSPPRAARWPEPTRLLVVGRLVPEKGVDVAIAALGRLHEAGKQDVDLTVAGDGPELEHLRTAARVSGVEAHVRLLGVLGEEQVAATMRTHDVLLVPSREPEHGWRETFGRVAAEGLASGMAVVASDTGGLAEALDGAGHLVRPDDPAALAQAVTTLLDTSSPAAERAATDVAGAVHPLAETWEAYDALGRALLERT